MRLVALAERLLVETRGGRVEWVSSARSPRYRFELDLPSGAVSISCKDEDDTHPFILSVFNDEGVFVESLRSTDQSGPQESRDLLETLFKTVQESALNVGGLVDSLLADIEGNEHTA
jgi:hypothetical protein